jgi:predicted unusual protein kinase regulating ubiquinone biosynthesis (AarF/ABC1/UbiB family)
MINNRYRRITLFFAGALINIIFWDLFLPRLGLRKWSQLTRPKRLSLIAAKFRNLAIQMGGVMIKVGQFFSARVDVLPVEITDQLAGLQDEIPAEEFDGIRDLIEAEFNAPLDHIFADFNPHPQAAASLGQVHQARLYRGDGITPKINNLSDPSPNVESKIVVKVQRPNIEQIIATDLAALRTVGNWLKRYRPISRRANVPALLEEFTRILYEEIDYLAEGRNAEKLALNFMHRPGVRFPQVIWTHTTKRVLTLEDVTGIKISDYEAITEAGIDRTEVAQRLFQTYLKQIFEDGFFHADPHPGNLFVTTDSRNLLVNNEDKVKGIDHTEHPPWLLTFIDFGMVGRLPAQLKTGLREMVIAVGTRDASRLIKSYQMLGVLLPNADLSLLEKAENMAFERLWGKSMSELREISPQELVELTQEFRKLIYTLPFQIPQDMILLGRTVGILSGMCTGLDPDFNVWEGLAPYAQKLISEETAELRNDWLKEIGSILRVLLSYPRRVESVLTQIEKGTIHVQDPQLMEQIMHLDRSINRISLAIVFVGLLFGGLELYQADDKIPGIALLVIAILILGGILLK